MAEQLCTLIVGRDQPEGACGAPAVGLYIATSWNTYRLRMAPGEPDSYENAQGKPIALCAAHRAGHLDWPTIQEFATPGDDGTDWVDVDVSCKHSALIDDVQHQCDVVGPHVEDETGDPIHTDGDTWWNDAGERLEPPTAAVPHDDQCGDVVVISDVTHTCTRATAHVDDNEPHGDDEIEWPLVVETAPATGGGKPRRG